MVMICFSSVILISFSIAASVVDLPLPVGPVTRIRPFSLFTISLNILGSFNSSMEGMLMGIVLKAAATSPFIV